MAEPTLVRSSTDTDTDQSDPDGIRANLHDRQSRGHWGRLVRLSSVQRSLIGVRRTIEQFLEDHPFERAPWLVVAFGAGIAAWVVLPGPWQWTAVLTCCAAAVVIAPMIAREGEADHLRHALIGVALMLAAGCATVWMKSANVGIAPIPVRETVLFAGRIVDRQDQGAGGTVRLTLAVHVVGIARPMLIRVMVPDPLDRADLGIGAVIVARARLAPPAAPLLPGSHDFAFDAWFEGVAATGSISGPVQVQTPAPPIPTLRRALRDHVLAQLGGSAGAIAATLVSGDRGVLGHDDAEAMRDAGFAHLLAIGGLHVSAVMAVVWLLVFRILALVPWIALRIRVPVIAALCAAAAGVGYCLITGSQVPTLRAATGAVLVLGALALGRDPLSMRLLAVAALLVMVFWPETVAGAGFQMSFGAVIAIVALYGSAPARRLLERRDESAVVRVLRHAVMLVLGGMMIQFALLPVALFHFHRAGVYGAFANLFAIPLVTLVAMPALAMALVLDTVGWGAPAWWVTGRALQAVLWIARETAALPGAVTTLPSMPAWDYGLWIAGALWLALWTGRVRLWGLPPIGIALTAWIGMRPPDILIAGDGRHVGITGMGSELVIMGEGQGHFARDTLLEAAGMSGTTQPLEDLSGTRCTHDFCAMALDRYGRRTVLLIARSHRRINDDAVAVACAQSDLVIADHPMPPACHPRGMLIDGVLLARTGGMTIDLSNGTVRTVAAASGRHPWLR